MTSPDTEPTKCPECLFPLTDSRHKWLRCEPTDDAVQRAREVWRCACAADGAGASTEDIVGGIATAIREAVRVERERIVTWLEPGGGWTGGLGDNCPPEAKDRLLAFIREPTESK